MPRRSPCLGSLPQPVCYHVADDVVNELHKLLRTDCLSNHDVEAQSENIDGNVARLVQAYRQYGHKKCDLDPLGLRQIINPVELHLDLYGLSPHISDSYNVKELIHNGESQLKLEELVNYLENVYCGTIGVEFEHLPTLEERKWFAEAFESHKKYEISEDIKRSLAKLLLKCRAFDHFLGNKFTTVKRYGGEGCESIMSVFHEIFNKSAEYDVSDVVICMPHRGRLNFLACMLNFPTALMFRKMKGLSEFPVGAKGTGDVLSHLYTSIDLDYNGKSVHISLIPNPSHLEANNPVAVGKTRAKQQSLRVGEYSEAEDSDTDSKVLCVQVHGDASFSAQGIVAETFVFAECPHFNVGGSVHLIVNNQLGFTTESERGRSSLYCSDLAKINSYPILHVNADNPEDVIRATALAMDYRQKFHRDVIIDLQCYRRWGHNELDDPSFTQPTMYSVIGNKKDVPDVYSEKVVSDGLCTQEELDSAVQEWKGTLNANLQLSDSYIVPQYHLQKQWSSISQATDVITKWDTGVSLDILKFIGAKSVEFPEDLNVHPTIHKTHVERRVQNITEGVPLDWATAEALAFGSLMYQGCNVRISGQDVGRGTFSHRHAMLVHQETDEIHIPLNHMLPDQKGFFETANSILAEESVLGFEYGMSLEHPQNLLIWEAQFGDFFNGAQPIVDTYISSGEDKWLLQSGIVMLLPHGMDGAGPEHSSSKIERFLQMTNSLEDGIDGDDVNMQIANPTTPAQYFHLLRRQIVRNFRKPLIVASPKMILRLPAATSSLVEMGPGTSFHSVLGDSKVKGDEVTRVIFCSGKHFYALLQHREKLKNNTTAIVRLEELCPFPSEEIRTELQKYPKAKEFIWSQEEHRNMGVWSFVSPRFENIIGCKLKYCGRKVLGAPAVGIGAIHKVEAQDVIEQPFC